MNLRERFALENGLSLADIKGVPFDSGDFAFRADPYGLRPGPAFQQELEQPLLERLTHLYLRKPGRFSNSLVQLSNAFALAGQVGISEVVCEHLWFLQSGSRDVPGLPRMTRLEPGADFTPPGGGLALAGRYFYRLTLEPLYRPFNRAEVIRALRPAMTLRFDLAPFERDTLVIHLRSGDVFRGDGAHPAYAQPPLAYYQMVIEHHRPREVHLVYEDLGNPVIDALRLHLVKCGIDVRDVCCDLPETVEHLLRARVLVAGRGSFLSGIAALSEPLQTVYWFHSGFHGMEREGLDLVEVADHEGRYTETVISRWKNSPQQRAMMLDYPVRALAFASTRDRDLSPSG